MVFMKIRLVLDAVKDKLTTKTFNMSYSGYRLKELGKPENQSLICLKSRLDR